MAQYGSMTLRERAEMLPDDMENYCQWKLMKDVKRLRLKAGVIPHIFDCQKKPIQPPVEKPTVKKRKHDHLVQEKAGLKKNRKRNEGSVDSSDASGKEAKRSRKLNPLPKRSDKSFRAKYDEKGLDKETGADLCDCLIEDCPGCWMDCPVCGSRKCGPECRVYRRYKYDYVEIEGADKTIKNKNK